LWYNTREVEVSEYYPEGPKAGILLMDFEYPQLSGVVKCELNTSTICVLDFRMSFILVMGECDLESMGVPSILNIIRKAAAFNESQANPGL
jgi:hypothetical protein